jgi:hypothetical protein
MSAIQSVTVGDRIIALHKFTGEIVEEKKWATTHVSGGGGGYNVGSGHNNPVSITSVSQTHDQFFLKNASGQELAVETTNAGLALRKEHRVTAFWGILQGQERGPFIAFYNHTTNNVTKLDAAIQGLAVPPTPGWVTWAWMASIFGICFYGVGFIAMIVLFITGRSRKKRNQELLATFQSALDGVIAEAKGA